jgi:hypothetical protein
MERRIWWESAEDGEFLYAEKPCEFVDRLGTYWHAWRPATGAKRRKAN